MNCFAREQRGEGRIGKCGAAYVGNRVNRRGEQMDSGAC